MKKISRHVHVSFGDGDSDSGELPHAAFPLYQTVDEFVETPIADAIAAPHRVPTLGTENFGESKQQQQLRMRSNGDNGRENSKVFTPDNIYTFQFYTMYADLAQWKIANLPGMPEIPLTKFCGDQPIRFAAYLLTPPSDGGGEATDSTAKPHSKALKDYLFCFSVHYNEANTCPVGHLVGTPSGSSNLICSPTASSLRSTLSESSIPAEDEPPAPRIATQSRVHGAINLPLRLARHEEALTNLTFELPMWIERVDPVAGNRKVSYLFVVNEQVVDDGATNSFQPTARSSHRYVVIRSASTIKNALLMLRDDADAFGDQREERAVSGNSRSHEDDFKKLLVESREFLYESVTNETNTVAAALQRIAATSTSDRSAYHLDKLKKAMLHHCLKSSGTLPRIRSYQEIGIQLTKAKRERMDTIWECGVYRVHSRQVLRQEWLMLTTNQVHFFRSYTMRACKSLGVVDIFRVEYVNAPHVLCPEVLHEGYDEEDRQVGSAATAGATQWHCVQLHLMSEVVTLFVDSEGARRHLVTSLNQIVQLQVRPGRLPASRTFESQPTPLCLNRRSVLPTLSPPSESTTIAATSKTNRGTLRQSDALTLAQEILQKGLTIYDMRPRDRKPSDLLAFLDAVELLNDLELPEQDDPAGPLLLTSPNSPMNAMLKPPLSHEEKLAFALNLYHILYIHATLVFALPTSHFQWKKLQSVPYYLIGSAKCPQKQLRVTLEAIEHGMLRASIPSIALSTSSHIGSARRLGSSSPSSPRNGNNQYDVPRHLALASSDFRTNFALQLNCSPGTEVIRVYSGSDEIHAQLNATSTLFLFKELSVDAHARVIWLPKICDWHQSDFMPRCSRTAAGLLNGSRAFYCLQKLLGFLDTQQREQVQQVLLGGGKSSRVLYGTFWTQSSRIVLPGASSGSNSSLSR
uniref:Uncharacterized protein n=1 Tax=Globisporangium ultimum (strain ATCC 200006 / CBS 805.95 / DAOM BR144) TaxID=431595 RepID=K3WA62_GLOUD